MIECWHATQAENVEAIKREGLQCGHYDNGGIKPVWVALQKHHALAFGDHLFRVEIDRELPKQLEWQIACYFDIPKEKITFIGKQQRMSGVDPLWQDHLSGIRFVELYKEER